MNPTRPAERLESARAGALAGFTFAIVVAIATSLNNWAASSLQLGILTGVRATWAYFVPDFLSGFLFGVTYRYAVRGDRNSFLKDGVAGAFALVRTLAAVEAAERWSVAVPWAIASFAAFFACRYLLEWAIARQWVRPLLSGDREEPEPDSEPS